MKNARDKQSTKGAFVVIVVLEEIHGNFTPTTTQQRIIRIKDERIEVAVVDDEGNCELI